MKKINSGLSLIEITIAVFMFAAAIIPIYYAISFGARHEIDYEKVGLANKILESFRDEVQGLDFEEVQGFFSLDDGSEGVWRDIQASNLTPDVFMELLEAQQEFQDFQFSGRARNMAGSSVDAIEFEANIEWDSIAPDRDPETIRFIKTRR